MSISNPLMSDYNHYCIIVSIYTPCPLAQARAPPLGNCASGPVNLLPFLTNKVAIMGMFVPVIYV